MQKNTNRLCPLPNEEVLSSGGHHQDRWTEQCGNPQELRYLGKAALVCPG